MLVGTLIPGDPFQAKNWIDIPHLDKIMHGIMFALFSFVLAGYLKERKKGNYNFIRSLAIVLILATVYGFIIEILQLMIPERNFEIPDLIANFIGSLFGLLLFKLKFNFFTL